MTVESKLLQKFNALSVAQVNRILIESRIGLNVTDVTFNGIAQDEHDHIQFSINTKHTCPYYGTVDDIQITVIYDCATNEYVDARVA